MKRLLPLVLGLASLCNADAGALVFWDTNGTNPGSSTDSSPTGTWSADALTWNTNYTGGGASGPQKWGDGSFAVFAAGDDAVGAYTVYVSNVVKVADIHVDLGTVTFEPDPSVGGALGLLGWVKVNPSDLYPSLVDTTNRLLSVGHKDPNATAIYNVVLTNATGIIRYKRGTLVFGVTNRFTGPLTIEGGVVGLGVPGAIPPGCPLILANNDTSRADFNPAWQYTPATFDSGGFDQQLGTLTMTGTDTGVMRALSLGNGPGTLSFADSSGVSWGGFTLTVSNYRLGSSKLRFGTSSSGLTAAQLAQMQFADFLNLPGTIDANGYVTPNLPKIIQCTPAGGSVHLVWTSVNGRTYRVFSKERLSDLTWNNLGDVYASDVTASYDDFSPDPTRRFYRVEVLP